jgi:hypothetical protein
MLPGGAEIKGVLSKMPYRIKPGRPRLRIQFHAEPVIINRKRLRIPDPNAILGAGNNKRRSSRRANGDHALKRADLP